MNRVHARYVGTLFILAALFALLTLSPTRAQTSADTVEGVWPTVTPLPTWGGALMSPLEPPIPTPTPLPPISPPDPPVPLSTAPSPIADILRGPYEYDLPLPVLTPLPANTRLGQVAMDYLVKQTGVSPRSLLLEYDHLLSFPLLGREFMTFHFLNTQNGEAYILLVDVKTAEIEELAAMEAESAQAYVAKYGKLDPILYDHLQTVDDATELPIGIWVASDYDKLYESLVRELSALHPEVADTVARHNMPFDVGDPVLSKDLRREWNVLHQRALDAVLLPLITVLEAEKITFEQQPGTPSLVATLTKPQIEMLAKRSDVQMLFWVGGEVGPAADMAVPAEPE